MEDEKEIPADDVVISLLRIVGSVHVFVISRQYRGKQKEGIKDVIEDN